jgi:hypothetical protein
LGSILLDTGLAVLLEFQIGPITAEMKRAPLAEAELDYRLPSASAQAHHLAFQMSRPTSEQVSVELPPSRVHQALSQLNLYRMQERARYEVSVGKVQQAGERLKRLATQLLSRGEVELAHTAIMEAERIQQTQMLSAEGEKQIKYGTRALLPAPKPLKAD